MPQIIEISTEKEIMSIEADENRKSVSVKGVKGLKLFIFPSGKKIFKIKYRNESGVYTTTVIGEWVKGIYGIKEAIRDSAPYLSKISANEPIAKDAIRTFNDIWLRYKTHVNSTKAELKTLQRFMNQFENLLLPEIKNMEISLIRDTVKARPIFLRILKSLQTENNPRTNTVNKILNRLNQIFDYAVINGLLANNPTRIISQNFSKHFIIKKQIPRKAILDIDHLSHFLKSIDEYWGDINVPLCMKWTILFAVRPSNAREARWKDINFDKKEWKIEGINMKMGEDFILPLTDTAIKFLRSLPTYGKNEEFLFRGANAGKPMSDNTMRMAVIRLGFKGVVDMHGFRSTFQTLMSELNYTEKLGFSEQVLSLCLDHQLRHKVKSDKAYNRAKYEQGKRDVFEYWHKFLVKWGLKI
ncbi:site-specific integrase [Campylobacter sp. RM15925]|uniref:tyrosine-type recombinase/integrase n=1 Tax=Campylobacter sp. RM15925 TaxID=1705724 RepID=UPI0014728C6B|nr:site-specific integrase [Campylobacter sp. RM15925]